MELDNNIQQLIEHKDFESLTSQEQKLVLSEMTREEYVSRRAVLLAMSEMAHEEQPMMHPSPRIKHAVYQRMGTSKVEKVGIWSVFIGWLNKPLPAYSLAIPILLVLFGVPWMLNMEEPSNDLTAEVVPEKIVDTVFLTKEVPVEVVKWEKEVVRVPEVKYVTKARSSSVNYEQVTFNDHNAGGNEIFTEAENRFDDQLKQIGKTAAENKDLDQFLTGVN